MSRTLRAILSLASLLAAAALLVVSWPRLARAAEDAPDRSTPRRAMVSFEEAAEAEDWARASQVLDLSQVPWAGRAERGRELAQQLHRVIERTMWLEPETLSDDPKGKPEDGADIEVFGRVVEDGREVPLVLSLAGGAGGREPVWRVSASTVARIPKLYERHEPSWLETRVPAALKPKVFGPALWQWLGLVVAAAIAIVVGRSAAWVAYRILRPVAKRTSAKWDEQMVEAMRSPARMLFALLAFRLLVPVLALDAAPTHIVYRFTGIVAIGATAWLAARVVVVLGHLLELRAKESIGDEPGGELRARGITTQVRVLQRVINVAISIVAIALMLIQFEVVRNVGVSLLASAGLAGVVLGFAAQRTFSSLIAGIQLSATQPIRIGDVVIVEKEWGTIEEITLTYVVVKVWDERRLIIPVNRFLEQPFENWTKTSAELHGTVYFYVDWTFPVDAMRAELKRLVTGNPLWDGRTQSVVVTDTKERTLEVRALVSAKDAGALWNLRCEVREKLVQWLQSYEGGRYLPRVRYDEASSEGPPPAEA